MKKTDLDLRLEHLENRKKKHLQLFDTMDSITTKMIEDTPKTFPKESLILQYQVATGFSRIFDYSNYLAKKIPDFTVLNDTIIQLLLGDETNLYQVCEVYQVLLKDDKIPFQDLDTFISTLPDTGNEIQNCIELNHFLDTVKKSSIPSDEIESKFIQVTTDVINAINLFYKVANFDYNFKEKHFVVSTLCLLNKYKDFKKRFYPFEGDIPTDAKQSLKSLDLTLEKLKYQELYDKIYK